MWSCGPQPALHWVEFSKNHDYEDLSLASDSLWNNILTPNGGFLISFDEKSTSIRHGIGMFHQLHCLQLLRVSLQSHMQDYLNTDAGNTNQSRRIDHTEHVESKHLTHCLDYLQQVRSPI